MSTEIKKGYLDQHCTLCGHKPVRYVKTKGGFHKVCDLCRGVLEMAGLLVEPDVIHAQKVQCDTEIVHGFNCEKKPHVRTGYLHGENDDTPYTVDGLKYCGRCHTAIFAKAKRMP